MSCDRRCFDSASAWLGHEDCNACAGKDDGASAEVKLYRREHWQPHADNKDASINPVTHGGKEDGNG